MQRLAPWQRIVVAMARGIILKSSGTMTWMANVDVLAAKVGDATSYSLFPIEADGEVYAAQAAARTVAKALYGDKGEIGFFAPQREASTYTVTCGLYQGNGLTRGRSLTVKVERIT